MNKVQTEYVKSQIKTLLSVQDILNYYVDFADRNRRYKCPFNPTESHKNLGIKGEHLCRCFSCGESWDEIAFVQKLFNYKNYHEALERIATDFNLDIADRIDSEVARKLNREKEKRDKERQEKEKLNKFANEIFDKICKRQYQLEQVIKENLPHNNKNLKLYAYTTYPSNVMLAKNQYYKNEMLLNIISESETDSRTDFIYGYAITPEERAERKNKVIDLIKQNVIKINNKGDVLYG